MRVFIKIFCLISLTFLTIHISAQKKDKVVMTIGDTPVSLEEFTANYKKNNTNVLDDKDKKTPAEYLDLYVNFKLKVLEAKSLGYDTVRSFVEELKGYRKELSRPYLTDVSYNEEMVKTAYYRTQHERKASHILIMVTQDATAVDTLKAWNKIADIRKQILEGADFNELALKYSEDPSAKENKGLLGYFSAFQMVYPFEDMAYKTPVGQVSEILRSSYGYHIIKIHDERLTRGEIKVAHIMKMFPRQATEETIANLKVKIDSIYRIAISGQDFAELAKKYSDDKQTAVQGGLMNWFTPTNMVAEFAEAAFALNKDGDISTVIRSPYGWHIIKRIELRTTPPFEKIRAELESKIKSNPAISIYSDEAFDNKLRADYQLKVNQGNLDKLATFVGDSIKAKSWPDNANVIKDNSLFQFSKQSYTVGNFLSFLHEQKFFAAEANAASQLKTMLDKYINQELIAYEDTKLEEKHPEFARIIDEYHDGILLFNISKDKIWDVGSADSARLQQFYDSTPKKYYFGDRYKGWMIKTKDNATRIKIETLLDQNESTTIQEIKDLFNTPTENNVEITVIAVEKGDDPVVDYYIWSGPKPAGFDETTTFVTGKIVQNEQKSLKDGWGLYSSDFQEKVEKEWIDSLRKKYPVKINKKVLSKIEPVE